MDIDIDFRPDFDPDKHFSTIVHASMVNRGTISKHPCGVYFQSMPKDVETGLAAIPYKEAASKGFFKVDFLKLGILQHYDTKAEVRAAAKREPNWNNLMDEDYVTELFQLRNHFYIVSKIRPTNIEELADCVAIIRPNKRHLLSKYIEDPIKVRPLLYRHDGDDKSSFKRSHAIAYATTIVLHMHALDVEVMNEFK